MNRGTVWIPCGDDNEISRDFFAVLMLVCAENAPVVQFRKHSCIASLKVFVDLSIWAKLSVRSFESHLYRNMPNTRVIIMIKKIKIPMIILPMIIVIIKIILIMIKMVMIMTIKMMMTITITVMIINENDNKILLQIMITKVIKYYYYWWW